MYNPLSNTQLLIAILTIFVHKLYHICPQIKYSISWKENFRWIDKYLSHNVQKCFSWTICFQKNIIHLMGNNILLGKSNSKHTCKNKNILVKRFFNYFWWIKSFLKNTHFLYFCIIFKYIILLNQDLGKNVPSKTTL